MTRQGYAIMRHHFANKPRKRGRWYVIPLHAGAEVVEADAGAGGGPGLVCTCEKVEDAEWIAHAWNERTG